MNFYHRTFAENFHRMKLLTCFSPDWWAIYHVLVFDRSHSDLIQKFVKIHVSE